MAIVEPDVSLGGPSDTVGISSTINFPSDSRGRRFFASGYMRGRIAVYDPAGSLLTIVGREGEGPGEFKPGIQLYVPPADSLYVFDMGNGRLTVLSPDLSVARMHACTVLPWSGFFLPDGGMLVTGIVPGPDAYGYDFHIVSPSCQRARSFGGGLETTIGRAPPHAVTDFGHSDRFVAVPRSGGYSVQKWSVGDGVLLAELNEEPDWYASARELGSRRPKQGLRGRQPPSVRVIHAGRDSRGLVWVATAVPDPEWMTAFDRQVSDSLPISYSEEFDTVLEAIDPRTMQVVARQRLDELVAGFSGIGSIFTVHNESLYYQIRFWRVAVEEYHPRRRQP